MKQINSKFNLKIYPKLPLQTSNLKPETLVGPETREAPET